jgi:hypothetical protein
MTSVEAPHGHGDNAEPGGFEVRLDNFEGPFSA